MSTVVKSAKKKAATRKKKTAKRKFSAKKKAVSKKAVSKKKGPSKKKPVAAKKAITKKAPVSGSIAKKDPPFIKKWKEDKSLSEIYHKGVQFALVSKDGQQIHPFVYCKDFLQDAIMAYINDSSASIYGFTYSKKSNATIDMSSTRIALRHKNKDPEEMRKRARKAWRFVRAVEKEMGFKPTELVYGGEFPSPSVNKTSAAKKKDKEDFKIDVWVFVGDKMWQFSPTLISLYSMLLRMGLSYNRLKTPGGWRDHYNNGKFLTQNDRSYSRRAKPKLNEIIGKDPKTVFAPTLKENWPEVNVSEMHNYSGIVSFAEETVPPSIKAKWKVKIGRR